MPNPPDPLRSHGAAGDARSTREARSSVMLSAFVEHFGGMPPSKHRVRDLSAGGVRIDQAATLRVGATVLVTVGLLSAVGATVVWVSDGWAGLKFAEEVNPDDARAKAVVAPRKIDPGARALPAAPPTAGWMQNVTDPYRK